MKDHYKISIAAVLILLALFARLIPHAANFTPVLAVALFAGAVISNRALALLVPLSALALSNLALGFSFTAFTSLLIITALVFLGQITKFTPKSYLKNSALGAVIFFVLSNFFVWLEGSLYPKTFDGLATCYTMAIPFFKNTLLSTVVYSVVLFEAYKLATRFSHKTASA